MAQLELELPKATVNLQLEPNQKWLTGSLEGLKLNIIARSEDLLADLECKTLSIQHPQDILPKDILSTLYGQAPLKCHIAIQSLNSPKFTVLFLDIKFRIQNVLLT